MFSFLKVLVVLCFCVVTHAVVHKTLDKKSVFNRGDRVSCQLDKRISMCLYKDGTLVLEHNKGKYVSAETKFMRGYGGLVIRNDGSLGVGKATSSNMKLYVDIERRAKVADENGKVIWMFPAVARNDIIRLVSDDENFMRSGESMSGGLMFSSGALFLENGIIMRPEINEESVLTLNDDSTLSVRAFNGTVLWSIGKRKDKAFGPYAMNVANGILNIIDGQNNHVWSENFNRKTKEELMKDIESETIRIIKEEEEETDRIIELNEILDDINIMNERCKTLENVVKSDFDKLEHKAIELAKLIGQESLNRLLRLYFDIIDC